MTTDITTLATRIEQLEATNRTMRRQWKAQMALALTAIGGAIFFAPGNRAAIAQGYGVTLASLDSRLKAVEAKTAPVSVSGSTYMISGKNVCIVDGTGSTASTSGLGNLTIGYNATGNSTPTGDSRTGSHNLILGDQNSYQAFGSLVTGHNNSDLAQYSGILASNSCTVSGINAVTIGGYYNTASGRMSMAMGGTHNNASDIQTFVLNSDYSNATYQGGGVINGYNNTASNGYALAIGGQGNTAGGQSSVTCGGYYNTAAGGFGASVIGGYSCNATKSYSTTTGGYYNKANGLYSSVSGGGFVTQNQDYGWSGGAYHNP